MLFCVEKSTLGALVSERVTLCHSGCSYGPKERKLYFWVFQGPTCKPRAKKNIVSTGCDRNTIRNLMRYRKNIGMIIIQRSW